jgi:flagellar motor switch protein FliN
MADDGILSQADIDALLNSGMVGSGSAAATSGFDSDSIRGAVDLFADQMGIVIGTLVNASVTASIGEMWAGESEEALAQMPEGTLALIAGFEQGFSGELALVSPKELVALLSEAMLGGDLNSGFKDDHLDAFKELGNQILGAVSTALGQHYEVSLAATQARISPFNPDAPPFSMTGAASIELRITLADKHRGAMRLLLSQPLVMAFTEHTEENAPGAQPARQPSPAASMSEVENVARSNVFDRSLAMPSLTQSPNVDLLLDIPLNVTIELGRSRLSIRKVLELGPGSIVELDRLAGEPVDLLVNDKVVARGEVVVVDEYFGIRVLSLISPEERIKQLR